MKISDAKQLRSGIDVEVIILKKGDIRTVNTRAGTTLRVCDCFVEDDSDQITLTLWEDDIDKVKLGDIVEIKNGYTNTFKGEISFTKGKYGELIVK